MFMHQQTFSQPDLTVGLARNSPWPFSALKVSQHPGHST
jgi:hypothetical protein